MSQRVWTRSRLLAYRRLCAAAFVVVTSAPVLAMDLTWNVNPSSAGAEDGASPPNWDTSATAWWDGSSSVIWTDSGQDGFTPDVAVFGAGGLPAMQNSPFQVTLGAPVTASGITLNGELNESLSGMYEVVTSAGNPLTLTPGATIVVSPNLSQSNGTSGTISGGGLAIASGTLNVAGTGNGGALLISGSNPSFAADTVAVSGNARLQTDSAGGLGNAAVTVAGGSQWFVSSAGTINNNISIAGSGWNQDSATPANQLGALRATDGTTFAGSITLTNNATIGANDGSSAVTLSGAIGGNFGLTFGQGTFTLTHANNTQASTTLATNTNGIATVIASGAGSLGKGPLAVNGGLLYLAGGDETVANLSGSEIFVFTNISGSPASNTITVSSTANLLAGEFIRGAGIPVGTFIRSVDVADHTITLSAPLQGTLFNSHATALSGIIANASNTAATLTFGGDNTDQTFRGQITESFTAAQGTGFLSLVKIGTGTETFSTGGGYSGTTTVESGTLNITGTLFNTGPMNITGGTLAVTGFGGLENPDYTIGPAGRYIFSSTQVTVEVPMVTVNGAAIYNAAGRIGSLWGASTGIVTLNGATLTVLNGGTYAGVIQDGSAPGSLTVFDGTLTLTGATTYSGATTVRAGKLILAGNGARLRMQSLDVNGTLDLTGNSIDIHYAGGVSPDPFIQSDLVGGYNNGAWTGTGITSSTAAADPVHHAVGYADGADNVVAGLAAGDELIKYTFAGDANLDGKVDVTDLGILASHYGNLSGQRWDTGDFTYNDGVDVSDLGVLATNYGAGTGVTGAAAAAMFQQDLKLVEAEDPAFAAVLNGSPVPEPASSAVSGTGIVMLLARCRRHGRRRPTSSCLG